MRLVAPRPRARSSSGRGSRAACRGRGTRGRRVGACRLADVDDLGSGAAASIAAETGTPQSGSTTNVGPRRRTPPQLLREAFTLERDDSVGTELAGALEPHGIASGADDALRTEQARSRARSSQPTRRWPRGRARGHPGEPRAFVATGIHPRCPRFQHEAATASSIPSGTGLSSSAGTSTRSARKPSFTVPRPSPKT